MKTLQRVMKVCTDYAEIAVANFPIVLSACAVSGVHSKLFLNPHKTLNNRPVHLLQRFNANVVKLKKNAIS